MDITTSVIDRRHELATVFAQTILPQIGQVPGADERTVKETFDVLEDLSPKTAKGFDATLRLLDGASLLSARRRFSKLDPETQQQLIGKWLHHPILGPIVSAVALTFKGIHFDRESVYQALGCQYRKGGPAEKARWLSQVRPGHSIRSGERIECDVVIVGTGAGGAVIGKELAARGHAVVFLEEGELYRRDAFVGSSLDAKRRFYRDKGAISAIGNTVIPTFMGRMVGGSTPINAATCFRPPRWILDEWCERLRTDEFAPDLFDRHLEKVERQLGVETSKPDYQGGLARVMARGCETLGFTHGPVRRNAPDCDGQGCCDFGCPSGAKRSVDVAYLPSALEGGALVYTGTRGDHLLIENGKALGIVARSVATGAKLEVRARAVVIACGAVQTPAFLLRQGLCNDSGQVGRNLSLHPMVYLSALFEERIAGHEAIPQSYFCDQFHRDGILLLGSSPPPSGSALVLPFVGRPLMKAVENFDRVATLGVLAEDEGRGQIRMVSGRPVLIYRLRRADLGRLHRGLVYAAEICRAAGAQEFYPLLTRPRVFEGRHGLNRFRHLKLKARDFVVTSFHPLGTCAMGADPKKSVVGLDHETHEVNGLYVVDGSTVPGPPSVNPQITIMAMAHRAAEKLDQKLD